MYIPSLAHIKLQRNDNIFIKDKMAGPKYVHYSEVPLNTMHVFYNYKHYTTIPNMSIIWRFYSIPAHPSIIYYVLLYESVLCCDVYQHCSHKVFH